MPSIVGRRLRLPASLKPEPALEYIAGAFDHYPIAGLSEIHGNRDTAAFLSRLIRHQGFSRRVNDIVIEFGSAADQSVVDRYGGGSRFAATSVGVWENTSQISGILPMNASCPQSEDIYRYFATHRNTW